MYHYWLDYNKHVGKFTKIEGSSFLLEHVGNRPHNEKVN